MLKHIMPANRHRARLTEKDVENKVVGVAVAVATLFFCTSTFLLNLARVADVRPVACAPAARLVPAHVPSPSPYEPACRPASEQAGELADYFRENF